MATTNDPRNDVGVREAQTQTDVKLQDRRLSKANLFTLLSLWMERFPKGSPANHREGNRGVHSTGLVVVREGRVRGLHCSGRELHAGQAAVVGHGAGGLAGCQLYFSRRPCATCLKIIINAGVSQIFFWPGDPEVSMLRPAVDSGQRSVDPSPLALRDAMATEKLRANSQPPLWVTLQPLVPGTAQYVDETARASDFMERVQQDAAAEDATEDVFSRQRRRLLQELSEEFLIAKEEDHRDLLGHMGLENFCEDSYLAGLRNNMQELVGVLASIAAELPPLAHGFYSPRTQTQSVDEAPRGPHSPGGPRSPGGLNSPGGPRSPEGPNSPGGSPAISQEVACHCMIQATLLAYRTEDPKVGVGAVIWAEDQSDACDGTGCLQLVGCGYNAYPAGSQFAQYPQMDSRSTEGQERKYRYIIHAEQNALTFRSREIRAGQRSVLFVTKCPCDECVPLISAAGITDVYTTDQDCGKDKGEISYLRFRGLQGLRKFIWQPHPPVSPSLTNGCVGKRRGSHGDQELHHHHNKKRRCPDTLPPPLSPPGS